MQIVISDSSCLLELHKAELLIKMVNLPFTFVVPQPLFDDELDSIGAAEKQQLIALGLQIITLPGEQVKAAQDYSNQNKRASIYACFALVIAESAENAILLTGDDALRVLAEDKSIETCGLFWTLDMLEQYALVDRLRLISILEQFQSNPFMMLPENEIKARIRKLRVS
ncbi:MAG: hypothetical protein VYB22_08820 [Pseudomonadota bacterium]|nr:hypothetical protein [Pseudomonadota bacterium]